MSDYNELVADLREADQPNWKRLSLDAAAAIEELQAEAERYNTDRVAAGYPDIRWTDFNKVTCKETGNLTTTLQSLSNTEVQS